MGRRCTGSKFSLDVLQRRVFPFTTQAEDPDILRGAAFGEDVALTRVGGDILVSHIDPIVGASDEIGWLAVHVACNDVATSGVAPRWLLLLVLVPRIEDEELLEQVRARQGAALAQLEDRAAELRDRLRDGEVLLDRTWPFVLFPDESLRALRRQVLAEVGA